MITLSIKLNRSQLHEIINLAGIFVQNNAFGNKYDPEWSCFKYNLRHFYFRFAKKAIEKPAPSTKDQTHRLNINEIQAILKICEFNRLKTPYQKTIEISIIDQYNKQITVLEQLEKNNSF